ncbi:restriction endonuclease subunit S [Acinetobacter indicus]|uniref:restriction endonuclease subunit S n=1 Tax=Acinetobacter indicus TaxID=756892 RepID=UPI0013B0978D|nr:restriction endonuclease subunit S [Acinetobacter indicus]QIC79878.1 restriction endonuclease subunit S [Acinetobacter indicus]
MSEWQACTLSDVLKFGNGKSRPKEYGTIPVYGGNGILDYTNSSNYQDETIVIGRVGAYCGATYYEDKQIWVSDNALSAKALNRNDAKFLYYFLKNLDLNQFAQGSSHPLLTQTLLNSIEVVVPSSPLEQKAIASVLSSLDDKIDLLHRQNKTLEAMAETLFRQWFIEEAKEDWLTVQVKDIVKQIKPGTNYQPKRLESGIPFLNVRNLKNGQIDLQGISFISQEEYERVHKAWKPEVGDVLISRIGTLGIVAVLGKRDMPMAVHYNMLVLKPNLTNTAFLYFLLRSQYFQDLYSSKARQSVQEYVAVEDAEAIELKLPLNDAEFVKKQEQFSDLFNKIRANLEQIQTLENLRDTLLPKLMSGEVRVQYQTEEVA